MAKQKDGRYRAKITVGTDASGKSIVKYVSGRTKKELEAAKAAAREKYVTDAARTAGDLQHYSRHVPYFRKKYAPRSGRGEGFYRAFSGQKYFFKKSMQNLLTTIPV